MPHDFFDTTRILRDTITIYDAPTSDTYAGGIVGGTSVTAGTVAALIAPLTYTERLEVLGPFPDTVARIYVGTAVVLEQRGRVEVNQSTTWGTGVTFTIEGEPMTYMKPFTVHPLYNTAWLSRIQD